MWSSFSERAAQATKGFSDALEKTGEAITQAATKPKAKTTTNIPEGDEDATIERTMSDNGEETPVAQQRLPDKDKLLKGLQMGWTSMVDSTKQVVEETRNAIDAQQHRFEQGLQNTLLNRKKGFYKRDPSLPLDVEALRDAEVVYITDRIITMSHPAMASNQNPNITGGRKLAAVGHLLHRRHDGRYLVWNLSEMDYDISILNDQVLTFSFPGSPCPPLGLLLKLLVSMENWMKADDRNVAVVHCLTGKGRTSTVLAAFLCWMGQAGFGDINEALAYIAKCKKMTPEQLTIPSQRRYALYFKNMLDGVRPSQPPLLLKRIIMSEAPRYDKGPPRENMEETEQDKENPEEVEKRLWGCAPYLQLFKGGKLLFTTAATLHFQQSDQELPFVQVEDGPVPFNVEQIVQGDILVRCRHLTKKKQRVSMFRAAFHTGYAPANVMRLTKVQLDGACTDDRFLDDFFLDLIFEKVDAETAAKHMEAEAAEADDTGSDGKDKSNKKGPIVKASSYDSLLHGDGDSRFWDLIATHKQENAARKDQDPMFGPTVGRRRGEPKAKKEDEASDDKGHEASKEKSHLETFSIGNEFDFLPEEKEEKKQPEKEPEKDDLMDALNALDDGEEEVHTEEIVFDQGNPTTKPSEASTAAAAPDSSATSAATTDGPTSEEASNGAAEPAAKLESAPVEKADGTSADDLDMDALLASADEDLGDLNLDDFDDDDDDLEDLESMLAS